MCVSKKSTLFSCSCCLCPEAIFHSPPAAGLCFCQLTQAAIFFFLPSKANFELPYFFLGIKEGKDASNRNNEKYSKYSGARMYIIQIDKYWPRHSRIYSHINFKVLQLCFFCSIYKAEKNCDIAAIHLIRRTKQEKKITRNAFEEL